MKPIKKYTAIILTTKTVDDSSVKIKLSYGEIDGPHYNRQYPEEVFNTEEEAIEYAYKRCKYRTWMIVPVITFGND